jgi:nucleotide-binding universal stress UspA family protein
MAMVKYERILLATDFSEQARRAQAEAVRLARRHDAELHVVYVDVVALQGVGTFTDPQLPDYVRNLHQVSMDGRQDVALNYRKVVTQVVRDSSEAAGILRYAAENAIDLIVLGTHGRSALPELLLGSVAQAVTRSATCSVVVVGPEAGGQHARCILAPVDFSERSRAALAQAGTLAARGAAHLVVLHVVDFARVAHPEELEIGEREQRARGQLERFVAEAALPVPAETVVTLGPSVDEIVRIAARHDAGLVVIAASGHTDVQHLLLGSVCKQVVRKAPCPVLVHRETAPAAARRAAA